jgi:hypothetical protein
MKTSRRWAGRAALLLIATLVLGACNGDNGDSSPTTGPTGPTATGPTSPPASGAPPAQGINVTGTFQGSFSTNTGNFGATYTLTQVGSNVSGNIAFSSGSGGAVAGTLSGNTLAINSAGCPATATVSNDSNTITFTSFTCPNGTSGTGVFTRV